MEIDSLCKILLTLWSDILKEVACLLSKRCRLLSIGNLNFLVFSGIRNVFTLPGIFLFIAEAVWQKFCTHNFMVLRLGTEPLQGTLKCLRNSRWVLITVTIFEKCFNNESMIMHGPLLSEYWYGMRWASSWHLFHYPYHNDCHIIGFESRQFFFIPCTP